MRRIHSFAMLVGALFAAAAPAGAQGFFPLALEVRGGAAFPTGDVTDRFGAETGTSYGVNATVQATSLLGIYAGYDRAELGMDGTVFGEGDLTDEGFAFGGKLSLPFGGLVGLGPWIRAGAVYNSLTVDGALDDQEYDSGFGFEVGGGLSIPLGMVVSVTPGVRYRTYSPDAGGVGADDLDVSYFVADLGLSFSF